jgi:hypothetical protein
MKGMTVTIFLCAAISTLSNAAQHKIAYEHADNVFVADVDGSHAKKIAPGALPDISPDGTRVASTPRATRRTVPDLSAASPSQMSRAGRLSFSKIFPATIVSAQFGRRMESSSHS